jgi:hypothetical protein
MKDPYQAYANTLRGLLDGANENAFCRRSVNPHQHIWMVFTTYVQDKTMGVMCKRCGCDGIVKDPTSKEWKRAYSAPSHPYVFSQPGRVRFINNRSQDWHDELRQLSEM